MGVRHLWRTQGLVGGRRPQGVGRGVEQRESHSQKGLRRVGLSDLLFIAGIPLIMERPNVLQQSCGVFIHSLQSPWFECQESPGEVGIEPQDRRTGLGNGVRAFTLEEDSRG